MLNARDAHDLGTQALDDLLGARLFARDELRSITDRPGIAQLPPMLDMKASDVGILAHDLGDSLSDTRSIL